MVRPRRGTLAVLALFALSNALSLLFAGVRHGGDTNFYIEPARAILAGQPLGARSTAYPFYCYLLAAIHGVGLRFEWIVAVQLLFAALAVLAAMQLGERIGGRWTALLAGMLLAINPEIAKWNAYILTDSLYISMVVLAIWATWVAGERRGPWYAGAAGLVLIAALDRPNGWALVPVAATYCVFVRTRSWRWRAVAVTVIVLTFVGGTLLFSGNVLIARQPDEMVQLGEVIWNYPAGRLHMPVEAASAHHGWGALMRYSLHHPLATLELGVWRVIVELAHGRRYYAPLHNLLLLILVPFYVLSVVGIRCARDRQLAALLIAAVAVHLLMIAISYADWDGRFLLHFWSLLAIFAARGADVALERILEPRPSAAAA